VAKDKVEKTKKATVAELTERVLKLEEQMKSVLEGHDGEHRDDLKDEVEELKSEVDKLTNTDVQPEPAPVVDPSTVTDSVEEVQ
jgi:predicted phage gp36 major capsid-like protein